MKNSVVATRYAKALYALAAEQKVEEQVLNELRAMAQGFEAAQDDFEQLNAPTVTAAERKNVVDALLKGQNTSELFKSFVQLLVAKGRLNLFGDIVEAYQGQSDILHDVTRGVVKSPSPLSPEERGRLEKIVSQVTKKKAILEYKESPELIGGLLANVGSYTFDDSLDTQLRMLYENLNRRAN